MNNISTIRHGGYPEPIKCPAPRKRKHGLSNAEKREQKRIFAEKMNSCADLSME